MSQQINPDFFAKKFAKENNEILFSFFEPNKSDGVILRCHYMFSKTDFDYDKFLKYFYEIVEDETNCYPYCDGGNYEFQDASQNECTIEIDDYFLTQIKIFNYPDDFEEKHMDNFIKTINDKYKK